MRNFRHYGDLAGVTGDIVYVGGVAATWAHPSVWSLACLVVAVVVAAFSIALQRKHFSTPCELCAAAMPLDAHAQAERRARSLTWFHLLTSTVALFGQLVLILLAVALPPPWMWPPLTVVGVMSVARGVVSWRHRPLQLACPWCRWDDRDDDEDEHTPTPDPVGRATA